MPPFHLFRINRCRLLLLGILPWLILFLTLLMLTVQHLLAFFWIIGYLIFSGILLLEAKLLYKPFGERITLMIAEDCLTVSNL